MFLTIRMLKELAVAGRVFLYSRKSNVIKSKEQKMKRNILKTIGIIIGITGTAMFLITMNLEENKFNNLSKALMMLGLLLFSIGFFRIKK